MSEHDVATDAEVTNAEGDDTTEQTTYFGNVAEWVDEWLVPMFRRRIDGQAAVWNARWWEDPEAQYRLEALWRGWEETRLEPGAAVSAWIRDHLDYHMAMLMSPLGPFRDAKDQNYRTPPYTLPTEAAPAALFRDQNPKVTDNE